MKTPETHVTPSIGRIVWYRGQDNIVRAAIVTHVWSQFLINLHAFGKDQNDPEAGIHTSVTHGDIEHEPSCCPSWSWMPYQKGQAAKTEQLEQALTATEIEAKNASLLPHQWRVVEERDELTGRIARLYDFADEENPVFTALDSEEQGRLRRQLTYMTAYANVLDERIAAFQRAVIPADAEKSIDPVPTPAFAENSLPGVDYSNDADDARMEAEIQTLNLIYPRVEKSVIYELMLSVRYKCHVVEGTTTTMAVAVLPMGNVNFTLAHEFTACVDPRNFNAALGEKYAIQKAANAARDKLWELEGYFLAKQHELVAVSACADDLSPHNTINS